MSADGDAVRAFLTLYEERLPPAQDPGVEWHRAHHATARLEAAARDHEDQEWNLIVAQRDALETVVGELATAREATDCVVLRQTFKRLRSLARAALAEAGLE